MADIIKIGIDPILVRLGPIAVHWYGLMYVVGILAAIYITIPYAERRGISKDAYYGIFWPVLIAALVGGRLYYVVQSNLGWYLQHPQNILATWEGGMAFYGAIFLGVPALILACRRLGVNPAVALDVAALFAPVGQAFGRIGNIINGDIVGYPSTLPWATEYTNSANTFVASHAVAYQPAAAYELLFSLVLFAVLWSLRFRYRVPGTLFALWVFGYSVGQFLLFFVRANIVILFGLKQAQLTAIAVVVALIPLYWLWRHYWESRQENREDTGLQRTALS
ncbi:MAG TPA: prolipoprotein diacylglyceryl transferase [Chloroflexota bacterium]|nr:prolipoprotein diacylglyceryl transferase [Chloroflexota bacterium]